MAVDRDPNFGLAYAGMAIASRNLDNQQDAEKYVKEAVRHLDGMTERERYRTRGLFYYITGDYPACVKEYGDLIARYLGRCRRAQQPRAVPDLPARHASSGRRDAPGGQDPAEPRAVSRESRALRRDYASDFLAAEQEARAMKEHGPVRAAGARLRPARAGPGARRRRDLPRRGQDGRGGRIVRRVRPWRPGRLRRPVRGCVTHAAKRAPPRISKAKDADRAASKLVALADVQAVAEEARTPPSLRPIARWPAARP